MGSIGANTPEPAISWIVQVARMCVACLQFGHTQQVIQGGTVLAKQGDWQILLIGLDYMADIGAEDEAAMLRSALAGKNATIQTSCIVIAVMLLFSFS